MTPYEKRAPYSIYSNKESHKEFPVKHDMLLRFVVICIRLPFNTYYAKEVRGAI